MTLAQLAPKAVTLSIFLTVFAFGLNAPIRDALSLFRRPALLFRSLLAMNVVMVIVALGIVHLFELARPLRIALLALSISPVPPVMPRKQESSGGTGSYAIGLLVAAVVAAFALIPIWVEIFGHVFGIDIHVRPHEIAPVATITILAPLAIGMLIRHFAPGFAKSIVRYVAITGLVLLVLAVLPVLFMMAKPMWDTVGSGTVAVSVAFTVIGLAVGHLLGGPDPDDRTVLAFATCARHPAIAMTIAGLTVPDQKPAVVVIVLLQVVVAFVLTIPYRIWRTRAHATHAGAA